MKAITHFYLLPTPTVRMYMWCDCECFPCLFNSFGRTLGGAPHTISQCCASETATEKNKLKRKSKELLNNQRWRGVAAMLHMARCNAYVVEHNHRRAVFAQNEGDKCFLLYFLRPLLLTMTACSADNNILNLAENILVFEFVNSLIAQ